MTCVCLAKNTGEYTFCRTLNQNSFSFASKSIIHNSLFEGNEVVSVNKYISILNEDISEGSEKGRVPSGVCTMLRHSDAHFQENFHTRCRLNKYLKLSPLSV